MNSRRAALVGALTLACALISGQAFAGSYLNRAAFLIHGARLLLLDGKLGQRKP